MSQTSEAQAAERIRTGDLLVLETGPLVFGGACLSRAPDGRVALVSFAIPGEAVEALVERVHPDYLECTVTRVIHASPDRIEPRCPLFGQCGGCQLQHMAYEAQVRSKETIVREQLRRIGGLADDVVKPAVAAADPWGYRNHIRFSTGKKFGDLGFIHRRRRSLLKVEECAIADPWVNDILPHLQGKGRGLHQVQLRHSAETGDFLIAPTIDDVSVSTGQRSYRERLADHDFTVSANAFFQVNHAQAEEMARLVGEALPPRGNLLVDAFAGVGTFAVIFADRFEHVIAIEESVPAARDAVANAGATPNVEVRPGKVEEVLPELERPPDAVLLDPPRPGCFPAVLDAVVRFRPPVVVYVSCNPSTFARDARRLVDGGYRLETVTPIDMFPQTGHIELVARFER